MKDQNVTCRGMKHERLEWLVVVVEELRSLYATKRSVDGDAMMWCSSVARDAGGDAHDPSDLNEIHMMIQMRERTPK